MLVTLSTRRRCRLAQVMVTGGQDPVPRRERRRGALRRAGRFMVPYGRCRHHRVVQQADHPVLTVETSGAACWEVGGDLADRSRVARHAGATRPRFLNALLVAGWWPDRSSACAGERCKPTLPSLAVPQQQNPPALGWTSPKVCHTIAPERRPIRLTVNGTGPRRPRPSALGSARLVRQ